MYAVASSSRRHLGNTSLTAAASRRCPLLTSESTAASVRRPNTLVGRRLVYTVDGTRAFSGRKLAEAGGGGGGLFHGVRARGPPSLLLPAQLRPAWRRDVVSWTAPPMRVGLVGAAFRGGQLRLGVDEGPKALRQGGFLEAAIKLIGHTVRNYDDLRMENLADVAPPVRNSNMHRVHLVGSYNHELSRRVEESVYENDLTVILGGDHSISLGSVHGHAAASSEKLAVIWIDAHADLNTPTTSTTKNGHGMVLSFLCREMRDYIDDQLDGLDPLSWLQPPISCRELAYIGLRDVEPWERVALDYFKICAYDMQDVDDIGAKEAIRQILIKINPQLRFPIHLSFDIDSLCPEYGPSTGLPVAGGLTLREVIQITEIVAATGRLRCLDITELNPKIGTTDDVRKTAEAAHAVILAACGNMRGGMTRRGEHSPPYPTLQPTKKYV